MTEPVCVEDIQKLCHFEDNARRYYMSGADSEQTLSENVQAFRRLRIRPRMLQGIEEVNTKTTILGEEIAFPVCVAPTAFQCMAHQDGEKGTVRAATAHGTCMCVSTLSTTSYQDIRNASPGALLWMQMYVYNDKSLTLSILRNAEKAGYKALVLTVDTPILGLRREDVRHKFKLPSHLKVANLEGIENLTDVESSDGSGLMAYCAKNIASNLSWNSVDWLRSHTKLPIILKGILTREDALECLNHDVQGIVVSNHGGRQLDSVPATIEALPEIIEAVNGKLEVYLDCGVRTGSDVFKALALGAKAVFVGRPVLWGLGYKGEEGVSMVLDFLKTEFKRTMHLAGCQSVRNITKSMVVHETHYHNL